MLTLIILRFTSRSRYDDGPYLAFATLLLDIAMTLTLTAFIDPKAGGVLLALNALGWVLSLFAGRNGKRDHARHLNRKAPR